jgi:hypothetical protein
MPGFKIRGAEERAEVLDTMRSGVLMGYGFDGARQARWRAVEFEEALARRLGPKRVPTGSSGTAAVFTASAACGVEAGDEVIVPSFTFVADLESVLGLRAIPLFAEIDATLCLDPGSVAAFSALPPGRLDQVEKLEMLPVALSLTPLCENALGRDWSAQTTPDKARELFART